jgi:hypothetical protein
MLRMPTHALTTEAKRNLQRFYDTSAAREIEDDSRTWTVVEWTWGAGPPMRIHLRDDKGDVVDFIMDNAGAWQLWREPIERRTAVKVPLER